jgi:hypothetical protein
MNVTVEELLALLGTKEAELYVLRKRVAELEAAAGPSVAEPDGHRQKQEAADAVAR